MWRGTSADERVVERKQRLLVASYGIVGRSGAAALTVRAVCATANVGQRYFYESYPDIEALLGAVYDFAVGQLLAAVAARTDAAGERPLRTRVWEGLDAAAGFLLDTPACGRIVFVEALSNEVLRTKAAKTLPAFIETVRQVLDNGVVPDVGAERARMETSALSGALSMVFADWLADPAAISRHALVSYCTDVSLALLALSRPDPLR